MPCGNGIGGGSVEGDLTTGAICRDFRKERLRFADWPYLQFGFSECCRSYMGHHHASRKPAAHHQPIPPTPHRIAAPSQTAARVRRSSSRYLRPQKKAPKTLKIAGRRRRPTGG